MPKLSATIAAMALVLALSAPAFAVETTTSGTAQGQDRGSTSTTGMSGNDSAGPNRDQSAQMPKASPGRVQEEMEQGAKNGQLGTSGQTPALEKPNNDAGSAQSSGPASSPAR
jgi:hypothetical protein